MADSGCLGLSALCPVTGAMGIRVPRESRFWKVRFVDVWNRFRPFPSFRIVKILNRFLFLSFVRESPKTKTGLFARIQIPIAEMSLKLASILSVLLLCILSSLSKVAGSCDSLPVYREHIRHSPDNASKSFWVGRALAYAQECGDTLAFYEFKLNHARLAFLQGDYVAAFDSMTLIESKVAAALGNPSVLGSLYGNPVQRDREHPQDDSLWVNLHVKLGIGLSEVAMSMNAFSEAVDLVTNIRILYGKDSTDAISARCYNAMGAIFASQGMTAVGKQYFQRSLEAGKGKLPDDFMATVYVNLAACYISLGEPEEALRQLWESYGLLMRNDLLGEQYVYALFYMGVSYASLGEYAMAERQFVSALTEAEAKDFGHLALYIRSNYVFVLLTEGKVEEAEEAALKNLLSALAIENLEMQEYSLVSLARIAQQQQDFEKAHLYFDSAYKVNKRCVEAGNKLRLEYHGWRLDQYRKLASMEHTAWQAKLLQNELAYKETLIACVLVVGSLLLLALVVLCKRFYEQRRVNRRICEQETENETLNQSRLDALQRDMAHEIDSRDKDLAAHALYDIKIRSLLASLSGKLRALRLGHLTTKEKLYVREMERLLEDFSSGQEWREFELYFKRVDNDFWNKLEHRFPDLTSHEKRLCAFVWLKLNTKEIAAITHRAVSSVYTAKNRLKKKLGLEPEASLYDFLHSL